MADEAQKLANKSILGRGSELPLQRRDGLGIQLRAERRKAPVAVEAREIGLPDSSLLEIFSSFPELRGLGAHHAQVVVRN